MSEKGQRVISFHNLCCLEDIYCQFSLALLKLRFVYMFYTGSYNSSFFSDQDSNSVEALFDESVCYLTQSLSDLNTFFDCIRQGCDMHPED